MHCPVCRKASSSNGYIAFCSCGHRWLINSAEDQRQTEARVYTDDYAGYRSDETFVANCKRVIEEEFLGRISPPARILDVGCGSGDFMTTAREFGYEVQGIDVSEAAAKKCRDRGLKAAAGDFLTEEFGGKFDLITFWDVVEHLREPGASLKRAHELLNPGGFVFAKVPAFGTLTVRICNAVPRTSGGLLGAPDHVQYFSRETLGRLFEDHRFTPRFLPGRSIRTAPTGGSLKSRLARQIRSTITRVSKDEQLFVLAQS